RRPASRLRAVPQQKLAGRRVRFVPSRCLCEGETGSRLVSVEEGEGEMMIGMRGETQDRVRDQRIERIEELAPPVALFEEMPLGEKREKAVVRGRGEVGNVLDGTDDRVLVVVGPCSVHDPEAALDYAGRLAEYTRKVERDLLVAMRVYFEKPRTTT